MKYPTILDGEWTYPVRKGFKLACCDCGLVHNVDFRLVGDKKKQIHLRMKRNGRSTGQIRRHMKGGA